MLAPQQRISRSRTRSRRSHHALRAANYTECPRCNSPRLPHTACPNCGFVRPGLRLEVEEES